MNFYIRKQFGFTTGKSTGEAISFFVSDIVTELDQNRRTVGVMMDLTKAFDCVGHPQLLECLRCLGLGRLALQWLNSYLTQREQCVQVRGLVVHRGSSQFWCPSGFDLGTSTLQPVCKQLTPKRSHITSLLCTLMT
ncbi:uncharacterized protein LOC124363366 [Homalodisca vitripennis]|uniref:uncharacterized protein LOC124363366 n=1 Tax=Homalodisca vitripennis TaxID=197043 RepID=UPI001EEA8480|nr:uncharacterized protein LOC124363366 [Homalodisca vitripennis]